MTVHGRFLRGSGHTAGLTGMQFVITLDADTQLPAGSAQKLIGTLAHPLNRPYYDSKKGRVTRGYGILQPTAAVTLPAPPRPPDALREVREMGYATKGQLRDLSGQEFDEVDGKPDDLRQCDPRHHVREALMDGGSDDSQPTSP